MRKLVWEKGKSRDIQGHRKCSEDPALSQAPRFILVSGAPEKRHKNQVGVSSEVQMSVKTEGRATGHRQMYHMVLLKCTVTVNLILKHA